MQEKKNDQTKQINVILKLEIYVKAHKSLSAINKWLGVHFESVFDRTHSQAIMHHTTTANTFI